MYHALNIRRISLYPLERQSRDCGCISGPDTTPNGAQLYSCSRNLNRPIVITEWIEAGERVTIPAGAVGVERRESDTEFGIFNYYKYMTAPIKSA